jgi:hypothetical protein
MIESFYALLGDKKKGRLWQKLFKRGGPWGG